MVRSKACANPATVARRRLRMVTGEEKRTGNDGNGFSIPELRSKPDRST